MTQKRRDDTVSYTTASYMADVLDRRLAEKLSTISIIT